jgi:hypothetical protein
VKNLCQALAWQVKSAGEEVEQLSRRVGELQELLTVRDGKLESLAKDLEQQGQEKTRLDEERSVLLQCIAALEEGLDPERLSRTYAALMAELQEAAGMGVHAVELTPATLAHVLPEVKEESG